MTIVVEQAIVQDAPALAVMVGELLGEIMQQTGAAAFNFNVEETQARARDFLEKGIYFVFIARDPVRHCDAGFIAMYESHALYAEGRYGTIPELYVRPAYRSRGIGERLLDQARDFGVAQGWKRLEVTTPPLPEFGRTLGFYEKHGFDVTGGRKLKIVL